MKNTILTILLLFFYNIYSYSQEMQKHSIIETETNLFSLVLKAGSCASPDGPVLQSLIIPPDYPYLNDNGYCLYSYLTTSPFTACFTFVAGSSSVNVNTGYSHNCNNFSFTNFRLFNSSCVQIATGLFFTGLTPGQTYTWCLDMRAWGGPNCNGFSTFCPYFLNIVNLPIELVSFTGKYESDNVLNWVTASERDNDYFTLENSIDGLIWNKIKIISGSGTTNNVNTYNYIHQDFEPVINYYRLSQTDYDGTTKVFTSDIVSIDNRNSRYIVKYVNSIGQTIDKESPGLIFIVYSDGTIKKHIN